MASQFSTRTDEPTGAPATGTEATGALAAALQELTPGGEDLWVAHVEVLLWEAPTEDQVDALASRVDAEHHGAVSAGDQDLRVGLTFDLPDDAAGIDAGAAAVLAQQTALAVLEREGLHHVRVTRLELQTVLEQELSLRSPVPFDLVGSAEAQATLGVSSARFGEIRKLPAFPHPVGQVKATPLWHRGAITAFLAAWPRRTGRPPKSVQQVLMETGEVVDRLQQPEALIDTVAASGRASG